MHTWSIFLMALVAPITRQVLISLGFAVVTYAGVDLALQTGFDLVRSHFSGFTGVAAGIVALSGVGQAMGIIAGGIVARVSMSQLKRLMPK